MLYETITHQTLLIQFRIFSQYFLYFFFLKNSKLKETEKLFLKLFLWFSHFFHNAVSLTSSKECSQRSKQNTAYSTIVYLSYRTYSTGIPSFGVSQTHFAICFGTIYKTSLLCLQFIIRSVGAPYDILEVL